MSSATNNMMRRCCCLIGTLAWCLMLSVSVASFNPRLPPNTASRRQNAYRELGLAKKSDDKEDSFISDFCIGTNTFWKKLVIKPVRDYVEVQPAESTVTSESPFIEKLTSPPEIPGIPRPVWLTILGSVPTGLVWYGYYKFSVEEELYQYEVS